MRKLFVAAAILVVAGLIVFFAVSQEGAESSPSASPEKLGASKPAPRTVRVVQAGNPADVGARGTAEAGSTPSLSQAPSEQDGVLEVVVMAGEKPVAGAEVKLYWRGPRDPNLGEVSWRLASTGTTNAEGYARLASKPGGYQVAVHVQGYASLLRDVVRPYGERRTFLRLTLQAGQVLTGRTVVRGTEEPLPMVELALTAHGRQLDRWENAASPAEERVYGSSDARGNFRVEGLAPGSYALEARAPGHARAVMRSVQVPASGPLTVGLQVAAVIEGFVEDAQGAPVADAQVQVGGRVPQVTTSGQGGGFSVEIEPGSYTLSARRGEEAGSLDGPVTVSAGKTLRDLKIRLGQGAVMEGRVVTRTSGEPISGASVDVSPAGRNGDSGRAVTDGTGHFSVSGLAPGSYDLVASAPGFTSETRRRLTVASGERFSLEIPLTGTGAVEGTVTDPDGVPVQGVQVKGGAVWGGSLGSTTAQARTDAGGHYRIEGLTAGPIRFTATREGAAQGEMRGAVVKEGGTERLDFILKETGTVEGVVRAAKGRLPVEALSVVALEIGGLHIRFGSSGLARTDLDASGHFQMSLPPGRYGLRVTPREQPNVSKVETVEVRVEAGQTSRVELTWAGETSDSALLRGVVLEPEGAPSVEATVMMSTSMGLGSMGMMAMADEEGRFSFSLPSEQGTSASSLKLTASNGGRKGELVVKPGEQEVVVKLQSSASLRGQVVRYSGSAPVQGFTLSIQPQARSRFPAGGGTWEFPGDRFDVKDVPAEPVKVSVRAQDGSMGEALVSLTSGASADVQVVLKATAGVRGRLVEVVSKKPASGSVYVEGRSAGSDALGAHSSPDGRFTLQGLNSGEHTLVFRTSPIHPRERRTVTLTEGQVLDLGDIAIATSDTPTVSVGLVLGRGGGSLLIQEVKPGSPAARAGIQVGDVLVALGGKPVKDLIDAQTALVGPQGTSVVITVRSGGSERTVTLIFGP
ncbi:carboxypeptidase regulatory-like domain-containing protein [Hyalangium versicolor]|uniref:carboxypeptidase regulatory-like domain-containing protein n=1 Tax=Hyalangium versicolor TaxID=2861190 RepID=UPI001CCBA10B|nr:carboxypeptidase regulatory-like domain-containing protein [Hyalangium versicolor]